MQENEVHILTKTHKLLKTFNWEIPFKTTIANIRMVVWRAGYLYMKTLVEVS